MEEVIKALEDKIFEYEDNILCARATPISEEGFNKEGIEYYIAKQELFIKHTRRAIEILRLEE